MKLSIALVVCLFSANDARAQVTTIDIVTPAQANLDSNGDSVLVTSNIAGTYGTWATPPGPWPSPLTGAIRYQQYFPLGSWGGSWLLAADPVPANTISGDAYFPARTFTGSYSVNSITVPAGAPGPKFELKVTIWGTSQLKYY